MSHDDPPARLKDLLAPVSRTFGLNDAVEAGTLWRKWARIVGPDIARHAEPTSLRNGVLRIRTDSPVWATEIGYLAADLRGRINDALGSELVTEVKVWTAPGAVRGARDPARGESPTTAAREPAREPHEALERARAAWSKKRVANGSRRPLEWGVNRATATTQISRKIPAKC